MELDCNRCIICQQDTSESLRSPVHSLVISDDNTAAYTSLTHVEQFRDIDSLPAEVYFGNDESADSFATHCVPWKRREHNTDELYEKTLRMRQALDIEKMFLL